MEGPDSVDPRTWTIREWKQVAWESVHEDRLLSAVPCFIFAMSIHSDGGGEADAIVYNGQAADPDNDHFQLFCADERYRQSAWMPPLFFHKGIYVDIGTNVDSVTIQYLPWHS